MLVSVAEFRQRLNGAKLTEGQLVTAAEILSGIQQELELFLNRPVEPVLVREFVQSDNVGLCRLSVSPVIRIVSTERSNQRVSGFELSAPLERPMDLDQDIRSYETMGADPIRGSIVPGGFSSRVPGMGLLITYVGGLSSNHPQKTAIKNKILEIAARSWPASNNDAIGLRDGQPTPATTPDGPMGWTQEELYRFERLRRRVVR